LDFGSKILKFIINDLCENYLESTKIYEYESTPHVALFSFIVSLEILRPLMPLFMQEIEKLFFNKLKISNFDISTI
jgi:valyl-tRNA synthetase